ncbi:helix-turn-helix domain-containing protein [Streptomyces sp. NPDC007095]|uniref:helix-turn-helix domain-containing protein n=1 Tax=Streptomyces sp. NPDC007095 TaxID=3154482 RepID=UPI0033DADEA1
MTTPQVHESAQVFLPLSPRGRAAIYLALGEPPDRVGRALGVDGSTVRRWRQRPEFRADVGRVRLRLLDAATATIADGDAR